MDGASFRLAPRRAEDMAPLVDLWVQSWQAIMPQIDFEARRDWFRDYVEALEKHGAVTICGFDAAARLAGFALVVPQQGHLEQIAVAPRHFGSGLAAVLLAEAKSLCPGGLTLDVNADNSRALRFYEREGFKKISAGKNSISKLPTWRLRRP